MAEKKSLLIRVIIDILKTVGSIVLVLVVLLAGTGVFVKVKYDVNAFALVESVASLSKNSGEEANVTNKFSDDDLTSYEVKAGTVAVLPKTNFTDKEVGAKLAKLVETSSDVSIAFGNNDLEYFGVEIVQILFKNMPTEQPSEDLCDINIVVHLNMANFKTDYLSSFPQSIFKNWIPDDIYVSCTSTVVRDDTTDYKVTKSTLTINALNEQDTTNVFNAINMFNSNFGKANEIATSLGTSTVDAILGTNGIVGKLKEVGARDYYFEKAESSNNLVVTI